MSEKYFVVRAMNVEDEAKAKVLEALVNRPDFVARIMERVNEYAKANLDEMIFGSVAPRRIWP